MKSTRSHRGPPVMNGTMVTGQLLGLELPFGEWHQGEMWVWDGVRSHGGSLAMGSVIHAGVHSWGPQVTKDGQSS